MKLLRLLLILLFVSVVFVKPCYAPVWGPPGIDVQEEDGSPKGRALKLKFANGNLTKNGDGSFSVADQTGAGGGDPVLVNTTAIADANGVDLTNGTSVNITLNAGVSPDTATFDVVDDSINGTELADAITLDANTSITLGASNFDIKVNSTGLFEVDGQGGFAGDLLHVHQHVGNPTGGNALHVEVEDMDMDPVVHISQTIADITNDTVLLLIDAADDDDANYIPLEIRDDSGVANDLLFRIDYTGAVTTGIWSADFLADVVKDTDIDWGSGAGQVDLADIPGGVAGASAFDFGGASSVEIPNGTADVALANCGEVHLNETDEQLSFHSGSNGEISGEVSISLLYHISAAFDPDAICDGDVDRVFLFTVGDDFPEGIIIDEWKLSFEADPTTEADLDLKRADAFIGVANAAVMDVLDTTNGASSEDTDANINSGAAVANGKVVYLEFGTAYTETGHQVIFEMWFHGLES